MEAFLEQAWNHANIPAELANLRPHGDFVLVRVIPEPEMQGRIVLPQGHRENLAPRIGEVIAVGPGDKLIHYWCCYYKCAARDGMPNFNAWRLSASKMPHCPNCGRLMELSGIRPKRAPMHVKPGDRILYWRTYANEVVLNDELYQLIHEEQHVVGVLEN